MDTEGFEPSTSRMQSVRATTVPSAPECSSPQIDRCVTASYLRSGPWAWRALLVKQTPSFARMMSLSTFLLKKRHSKGNKDIDGDLDALLRSSVRLLRFNALSGVQQCLVTRYRLSQRIAIRHQQILGPSEGETFRKMLVLPRLSARNP
jgi:hypothetical protein